MPGSTFGEIPVASAAELLNILSPLDTEAWPDKEHVFRGQPDATMPLEASAHRLRGRIDAASTFGRKAVPAGHQVLFEASLLRSFLQGCDRSGLVVPGDMPGFRDALQSSMLSFMNQPQEWPRRELYQILAVAQHHGIPTCFLDWTWRSYVAAYFAASTALGMPVPPSHLAIWALNVSNHRSWQGLGFVQMPGGTSSNLAAQAGVFTVSKITQKATETFIPTNFVSAGQNGHAVSLLKYVLPFDQAVPLLEGCHRLGVSGATLFPGYEGVAREVQDLANMGRQTVDWGEITPRDT